jgi:hypothetical protein
MNASAIFPPPINANLLNKDFLSVVVVVQRGERLRAEVELLRGRRRRDERNMINRVR